MHTNYVGSEPRCCFIAKKLIWWVAVICCTGGAIDATDAVVRAKAMTSPFMSKSQVAQKTERMPMLVSEFTAAAETPVAPAPPVAAAEPIVATPFMPPPIAPVAAAPAPADEPAPVVAPAPVAPPAASAPAAPPAATAAIGPLLSSTPFTLAGADPQFEAALSGLAMKPADAKQPVELPASEEEIPDAPFAGRTLRKSATPAPAPAAAKPVETVMPVDMMPTVVLPQVTDLLPRPRPPLTPAQELELDGKERAKAEKCLATAIYFEARNEPVRGQVAVAQVVLNRVFSPYYPGDVCGVVYQNAHRRLACQFTFACDGIPDIVREKGPWVRAQKIAKQALDSQNWLPEVAKATHYHATYVKPRWIRDMKKLVKHGQHIFYRPWNWGNGENEAGWGVASLTHTSPLKMKTARN